MSGLGFYGALGIDVVIWPAWSTAVSWAASRWSPTSLDTDDWLTRLRVWERGGAVYDRVGIRRWKAHLPDLGRMFGGRRKTLGTQRDPNAWRRLAAETRRAERVHWLILLALPLEAAVHGGVVLLPMTAYAVVANVPCIAVQRYNRGRLRSLEVRWSGRRSVLGG